MLNMFTLVCECVHTYMEGRIITVFLYSHSTYGCAVTNNNDDEMNGMEIMPSCVNSNGKRKKPKKKKIKKKQKQNLIKCERI